MPTLTSIRYLWLTSVHSLQSRLFPPIEVVGSDFRKMYCPSNSFQDGVQLVLGENSISTNTIWKEKRSGGFQDHGWPMFRGRSCWMWMGRPRADVILLDSLSNVTHGGIPHGTESHGRGVAMEVPVMVLMALFSCASTSRTCKLFSQTGVE